MQLVQFQDRFGRLVERGDRVLIAIKEPGSAAAGRIIEGTVVDPFRFNAAAGRPGVSIRTERKGNVYRSDADQVILVETHD